MKSIFTLSFVFFSLISFGQEETESESKFQVGLTLSPQISFAGINNVDFASLEGNSQLKFSWSVGAKSRFIFTKSFATEIGILYQQRNYESGIGNLIFGSQIITGSEGTKLRDEIQLNMVSIPVIAVFTIIEKWNISLGTHLNFYTDDTRTRTVTNLPPGEDEKLFLDMDTNLKTTPFEVVFGFGRRFNLGNLPSELNLIFSYNFNDIEFPIGGLSTIQSNLGLGWNVWFK